MTHRERLVRTFQRRPIDQLSWVPDLGYWIEAERVQGRLAAEHEGQEGRVRLHEELDACVYYGYGTSPAICVADGVEQTVEEKGGRRVRRITCDGYALEEHRQWLPASFCYAVTQYPVQQVSDLAVVREIHSRRRYEPNPNANAPARKLGGAGHPITAMPRSPLPALMADWIGVEGTIYMLADAPDEVEKTLEAIDLANEGFFPHLANVESPIVHFCDNLSSDTLGGAYWDAYCADYYRRRVAQVHDAGKFCVTHLDGTTRALIPKLMAAGLDGIESLTPQPVGDLSIDEMAEMLRPHDGLFWGGLPGAMFAPPFKWDDLKRLIDNLHRVHASGLRVVVASADLVPPDGDIDCVRRVPGYLCQLGA